MIVTVIYRNSKWVVYVNSEHRAEFLTKNQALDYAYGFKAALIVKP